MKKDKVKQNKRNKSAGGRKSSSRKKVYSSAKNYGKRMDSGDEKEKRFSLPALKPWKVILGAVIAGALGILYLNHVFATQKLLQEVNQLEREYNQAKRMHNDYRLSYDRMIGPAEIYEKAKQQGFINGGPAEKIIEVDK
jgi:cell division protein FtsL